jgi:hypothetical protein
MNLVLLPISPLGNGGYSKAVRLDLENLAPETDDLIVIYNAANDVVPDKAVTIERPSCMFSLLRFTNIIFLRPSLEVKANMLRSICNGKDFSQIFCGDVVLYRACRKLFPKHKITVRFHNLFSLVVARKIFRNMPSGIKFLINLFVFSRLERRILSDPLIEPIFINKTEQQFFELIYPNRRSLVWAPKTEKQNTPIAPAKPAFVYFGSYASHQLPGIIYFIKNVYLPLKQTYPIITLNFWGRGGKELHDPQNDIFHHGDYLGDGLPMQNDALFVNPDLQGGGIKFKIAEWLEVGVPFITTPYGIEGYTYNKNEHIIVSDISRWEEMIVKYFHNNGLFIIDPVIK